MRMGGNMANRYKKNVEVLCKEKPFGKMLAEYLEQYHIGEKQIKVMDGIPYFYEQEQYYRLHSEKQLEEADLLMRELDEYKDYLLVVFGMGNLSLLRKIIEKTSDGTRILVIEKNPYVMKYQFQHENLEELIKSNKLVISAGEDKILEYVIVACMGADWENLAQNLTAISMPNYSVYGEFRSKCLRKIANSILVEIRSLGNSLPDVMKGVTNNYKNVDACIYANGIEELKGQFKGIPGIVVGAGPSLDKNLKLLKQAEGRAVIITTDASMRACERMNVKPDAIASIERDEPTYRHFYKDRIFDKDMVLVGPGLLWPDILKEYPGKKVLMSKTASGTDNWWAQFFPQMEHLMMGFSCSTVAHAVLDQMGCEPIIHIGQDLALTGNKRHSENSKVFKNNDVNEVSEEEWEASAEDIYGNQIRTTDTLNLFRHTMEDMILASGKEVIDATEGGAKIKGTKIMTFQEAIDQYCQAEKPKTMNDCLEEKLFDKQYSKEIYEHIIEGANQILQDLDDIESEVAKHCERINKYATYDFDGATLNELIDVVLEMQKGNSIINYLIEEKKHLITFYQQNLKQTIIYVKKIGNDVTPETVKRNWELQENLMYMLEVATKAVRNQYEEIKQFMQEKIVQLG